MLIDRQAIFRQDDTALVLVGMDLSVQGLYEVSTKAISEFCLDYRL